MFETSGKAFFTALREAIARHLGRDHPSYAVVDRAACGESDDVAATHAVQEALGALDPDIVTRLMADVHKTMRESPRDVLAAWHGPGTMH